MGERTEKLYCYVDESGQDTKGRLFIVSVIITKDDRDEICNLIEELEKRSGKKATKWLRSKVKIKIAFIKAVINSRSFRGKIYFTIVKNNTNYQQITFEAIALAIRCAKTTDKYKASIFIDGLSRPAEKSAGPIIRNLGIRTEKVRGVIDESYPLIRLADAMAGLIKEKCEGIGYAEKLYKEGIQVGTLKKII